MSLKFYAGCSFTYLAFQPAALPWSEDESQLTLGDQSRFETDQFFRKIWTSFIAGPMGVEIMVREM